MREREREREREKEKELSAILLIEMKTSLLTHPITKIKRGQVC